MTNYAQSIGQILTIAFIGLSLSTHAQPAPKNLKPVAAVRVPYANKAAMMSVAMAGARMVAVGDHGVVLLSDDGGESFRQSQQVPTDFMLNSVAFVDAQRGWAVGHTGQILETLDGGEHWSIQRLDVHSDRPLFAVHFLDAHHGVAVGLWSLILVTSDAGRNWTPIDPPPLAGQNKADLNLWGLFANNKGQLYAVAERGMVLRSDDKGLNWTYLSTGYKGSFWTGMVAPDGGLIVAGQRGNLYRSSDEGKTWVRVETHTQSSITGLVKQEDGILAVGLDGLVMKSQDSGHSFSTVTRLDRAGLTAVAASHRGPVFFSRAGVLSQTKATSR
jgi:photosystem II stability/assembly factor-like uncharacterized protein